jgi:hypothetical protein
MHFILATGLLLALAAFWDQICSWYADHLRPWFTRHIPSLAPLVDRAFASLDRVVSPVRAAILDAWELLRPHILGAVMTFERASKNTWIRRVCTYVREGLERSARVTRVTEEETLDWSDLPEEIRAKAMRRHKVIAIDLVKTRDEQLGLIEVDA